MIRIKPARMTSSTSCAFRTSTSLLIEFLPSLILCAENQGRDPVIFRPLQGINIRNIADDDLDPGLQAPALDVVDDGLEIGPAALKPGRPKLTMVRSLPVLDRLLPLPAFAISPIR